MTGRGVITEREIQRSARAGEASIDVTGAVVLTLGAGLIGPRLATSILDTFLATPFGGGRHKPRVDKIDALDRPG